MNNSMTIHELKLPDILREHRHEVGLALLKPIPNVWTKGDVLATAEQPAAIGSVLIEAIHSHLAEASIAYAYREFIARRGKIVLAQASKGGPKLEFFAGIDLVIEVNWEAWSKLNREQRIALMDHELSHFARLDDEGKVSYVIVGHDIEEFGSIVSRWGLWEPDLMKFAAPVVRAARQLDLLVTQEPTG